MMANEARLYRDQADEDRKKAEKPGPNVGWLEAAQGFWEPEPAKEAPAPVAAPPPIAGPPPILMAAPTITAPSAHVVAALAPPPPEEEKLEQMSLPLVYLSAGVLGMVAGIAFSALVIMFVELPMRG